MANLKDLIVNGVTRFLNKVYMNEAAVDKLTIGTSPVNNADAATKQYVDNHVDNFDLSDRMAKGVDDNGEIVAGAIIEGKISGTYKNKASGADSHAEGNGTTASGQMSHAEGGGTIASSYYSHAEGGTTKAQGVGSHAEGGQTTASGNTAHAEGNQAVASGASSHAEGSLTTASGNSSHAEGYYTIAARACQHAFGAYNVAETGDPLERGTYIEIVGNGFFGSNGTATRSNARTLDWNGNERLAGSLTLGMGTANETTITGSNSTILKVTKTSVSSLPTTISNSKITASHQVINWVLSNSDAQVDNWTATTSAGSISITGTINGTTDITLYLSAPVT